MLGKPFTYLERQAIWQELKAEVADQPRVANTGRALVPYSLRHGFADRADRAGFSRREACLAMGHSSQSPHVYEAPSAATAASSISKPTPGPANCSRWPD